jgi:excisionase family DNA binding protein
VDLSAALDCLDRQILPDGARAPGEEKKPQRNLEAFQNRGAFKLKEACQYLGGISPATLRRLIIRGLIRRHPALRHIVISKAELDRFLAQSGRT